MAYPSCTLATFDGQICNPAHGGVRAAFLAEFTDVDFETSVFTADAISTLEMNGAAVFARLTPVSADGVNFTEDMSERTDIQPARWLETLNIIVNTTNSVARRLIDGIQVCCDLVVIVEFYDGTRVIMGIDQAIAGSNAVIVPSLMPCKLSVGKFDSGNPGGGQTITLTFTATSKRLAQSVTASIPE